MRKEIKTKKQLIERLNEIDRKCIDEGTHFYDFKTLFEASSNRLSAQDKLALKKAVDIGDKEAIEAVFQAKMAEDLDLEDEFDDYDTKLSDKEIIRRIFGSFGVKLFNIVNEFDGLISVNVDAEGYREVEDTLDREIFNNGFDIVDSNVGEPNRYTERETLNITLIKDDDYNEEDDLELTTDDMNGGQWFESLVEPRKKYKKSNICSKAIEEDFEQDWDPEYYAGGYTEWDLIDSKRIAGEESYNLWYNEFNDRWVCTFGDSDIYYPENVSEYDAEFEDEDEAREWFEDYTSGIYSDVSLNESSKDGISRYSDVIPKEERKFWYFTTHGVQPGSIPNDLNVLEIKDTPNGTFVALDGVLNTSELRKYDMKEKSPMDESLDSTLKEEINLNDYDDGYVELRDGKPQFVYSTLRDAKDGMFWSQMGDNEHGLGKHSYEIKKWENGKLKDLNESYEDGEYDYFVVYKGKIMQGEYPTYSEAKRNAGEGCIIKGVIQYGGSEFEETEIKESFNEDFQDQEEFEYEVTIYIDAYSQDDYFDYDEYEYIDKEEIQYSLNSYIEKISLGMSDYSFDIIEEDVFKDRIIETLYIDIPKEENITEEQLKNDLRKIINDWSYTATEEIDEQTDVDDFVTHYIDVEAYADIDTK